VSRKSALREQATRVENKVEFTGEFMRPATREEEKKMDRKWWQLWRKHGWRNFDVK
jgi:hypothetical protein